MPKPTNCPSTIINANPQLNSNERNATPTNNKLNQQKQHDLKPTDNKQANQIKTNSKYLKQTLT